MLKMVMVHVGDVAKYVTTFLTMFIINIYLLIICKQIILVMVANFKRTSSFSSLLTNINVPGLIKVEMDFQFPG